MIKSNLQNYNYIACNKQDCKGFSPLVLINRGNTILCLDGLLSRRELGQSPINMSATYDGKRSRNQFFTMVFVVTLGQSAAHPFLDPERTG